MISEHLRKLVDHLDKTHNEYVRSIITFGKITPIASEKASEYKMVQREIVKTDNEHIIKK